jgi:hypothetical protein
VYAEIFQCVMSNICSLSFLPVSSYRLNGINSVARFGVNIPLQVYVSVFFLGTQQSAFISFPGLLRKSDFIYGDG